MTRQNPRCPICDRRGWPDEGEWIGTYWYCSTGCAKDLGDWVKADNRP